jgi:hypothetical protein
MQALKRGNEIRLARAERKREIFRGDLTVATVVEEVPWECETITLAELLTSQRRWGRTRARKLLSPLNLPENKRLGDCTDRQRRVIVAALSGADEEELAAA